MTPQELAAACLLDAIDTVPDQMATANRSGVLSQEAASHYGHAAVSNKWSRPGDCFDVVKAVAGDQEAEERERLSSIRPNAVEVGVLAMLCCFAILYYAMLCYDRICMCGSTTQPSHVMHHIM